MPCRILLAHSHEIVRLGLRTILEANRPVSICGEAADGFDAIRQAHQLRPDIIIVDYNIPKANGFIVSRRILRRRAEQKLIIMDVVESAIVVRRLIRAGVRAVISMSEPASVFVNAIDALQRNRPHFPRFIERLLLEHYLSPGRVAAPDICDDCLSLRQQEVVQLLAEGRSTKEVAAVLGLSTKTAETHRSAILHKLQLHNIAQLTRYAVSQHILNVARLPQPIPMPSTEGPERAVIQNAKALRIAA
jgi:DNA-binding NarL/FixJ family response regulator